MERNSSTSHPRETSTEDPLTSELWLDCLVEGSAVPTSIASSKENRYVRANQAMAEFLGMPREEILRADPFSLALRYTHLEDLPREQVLFRELMAGTRSSYQFEKRYVRPDGSIRIGALSLSVIRDLSGPESTFEAVRYVVMQVVDVTDRKALEAKLERTEGELRHAQKLDGVGRLAAGVAHDFNNLLTAIIGHAELLKLLLGGNARGADPKRVAENLQAILEAAERSAGLTAQLLAYGRRETVAPTQFGLSREVGAMQRLLARTLGPNVEVTLSLDGAFSVFADAGQVGQVVMNLVLNARDALPAEGGRIEIATRDVVVPPGGSSGALPEPGEWAALSVTDNGHGMTAEVQARIFEPFFTTRGDRPGTRGTGLGLSTAQRIVAEAGGRMSVRSAPGAGTTMTVYFPRSLRPAQPRGSPALEPKTPKQGGQRILVVDDEPAVRNLVAAVLLAAQYWVRAARSGEEALQFVAQESEPFDLVVSDLMMPGMGGAALAKALVARGSAPRMLFISGYSDHAPGEIATLGRLLAKPFTPAQLLEAVDAALDGTRALGPSVTQSMGGGG